MFESPTKQMQAAVQSPIGQRLVARVDDRATELDPLVDLGDDVVGPLRELESNAFVLGTAVLENIRVATDSAGTSEYLARDEKGQHSRQQHLRKRHLPPHEVVFVAAKSSPCVVVDIVLEKGRAIGQAKLI